MYVNYINKTVRKKNKITMFFLIFKEFNIYTYIDTEYT